ncbi:N-alpha-acetyltransferase 80 [Rhipicephalus microplus]|uniref:N-alpha-acetyltransferase 80 n=1 Tax=Rhipicephalus microplus TaxID=6941 RepID=UPI003F6D7549
MSQSFDHSYGGTDATMELVELHDHPEYINACCEILNNQWKRSHAARYHSLSKSSSDLPVSLALLRHRDGLDGQVIGHAKLSRVLHDDEACFVESVIVIPEERGKGFGKLVMKLTEEYARKKGFTKCYLSTHDKEQFYEAIGYTICAPVCAISGAAIHVDRLARLFNGKPKESPAKGISLGKDSSQKVHCPEMPGKLLVPPPPPPLPSPQQKVNANNEVWMMKKL